MTTSPTWRQLTPSEGNGYEVTQGAYRGRYETCECNNASVLRNRKWTVWHRGIDREGIAASGYCYGSAKAEKMILLVIKAGL